MKNTLTAVLILLLTATLFIPNTDAQEEDVVVSFRDVNLAKAVHETLGLRVGEPVTTHAVRNLTELDAESKGIRDLTGLEHAVHLGYLNLRDTAVSDVSALANLTQLEWLFLRDTAVSDVSALANLTQLVGLSLGNTAVSDVSVLAHLTQLGGLSLRDTAVSDVSALANLTQLGSLSLDGTGVSDVSALANLTQLGSLSLDGTGVSDVSALANLTQLGSLSLDGTGVSDVSALANLAQLEYLYLSRTSVSDVSVLANFTQLRYLSLGGTSVSDVSALANLAQLEWLSLSSTGVSDVSALANLTQLYTLSLNGTGVSDVSPLLGLNLPGVSWDSIGLRLKGCPLSYASVHTHLPSLAAKGIEVEFDDVAHPALLKVSGDGQEGAGGLALSNPFVVEAMDEHGKPIVDRPVQFEILAGNGLLSATTVQTDAQGKAQITLILGPSAGINKVKATSEGIESWVLFNAVATEAAPQLAADVNGDGVVNLADLTIVAQVLGKLVEDPRADVNGDGVVDGEDFAQVAANLGQGAAAAPSSTALPAGFTREKGEWALNLLHAENTGSPAFRRGIAKLEGFLELLVPEKTLLLANYPNPFNPETWIPYQLANPADVTVTIYAANGAVVRTLALGHQRAGSYASRSRAAYWDGRNNIGERVASGVYFYTLSAGEFSATRKMLILK